jgi:hypothetical protein
VSDYPDVLTFTVIAVAMIVFIACLAATGFGELRHMLGLLSMWPVTLIICISWWSGMALATFYAQRHEATSQFWSDWMADTRKIFWFMCDHQEDVEASHIVDDITDGDVIASDHTDWLGGARLIAVSHADAHGEVSSDDIWEHFPPPDGCDPRIMGAVFHPRSKWEIARRAKSTRKQNHGRIISVWRLAEHP